MCYHLTVPSRPLILPHCETFSLPWNLGHFFFSSRQSGLPRNPTARPLPILFVFSQRRVVFPAWPLGCVPGGGNSFFRNFFFPTVRRLGRLLFPAAFPYMETFSMMMVCVFKPRPCEFFPPNGYPLVFFLLVRAPSPAPRLISQWLRLIVLPSEPLGLPPFCKKTPIPPYLLPYLLLPLRFHCFTFPPKIHFSFRGWALGVSFLDRGHLFLYFMGFSPFSACRVQFPCGFFLVVDPGQVELFLHRSFFYNPCLGLLAFLTPFLLPGQFSTCVFFSGFLGLILLPGEPVTCCPSFNPLLCVWLRIFHTNAIFLLLARLFPVDRFNNAKRVSSFAVLSPGFPCYWQHTPIWRAFSFSTRHRACSLLIG